MPSAPRKPWRRLSYTLSFYWKGDHEPTPDEIRSMLLTVLTGAGDLPPEARSPLQLEGGPRPTAYAPSLYLSRTEEDT